MTMLPLSNDQWTATAALLRLADRIRLVVDGWRERSQLRRELMHLQDFNFRVWQPSLQRVGRPPGHAIIRAQRISVGDDENAGHIRRAVRSELLGRALPRRDR